MVATTDFPTPSGKIEILSHEAAARWGVDTLPAYHEPIESIRTNGKYRFYLMTPTTKNNIHSQFHNLEMIRDVSPKFSATVHPADAREKGIQEGDRIRVFNDRGELKLEARFDYGLKRGCVVVPNGWWIPDGGTVNFLSEGRETDMGHGAAFHENLVDIEKTLGMQKAFVFDLNRCTGCDACQIACKIENELPPGMSWRQVVTFNESRLPGIPLFSLSLACNHCLDAPCKEKCPALAYSKDERTGAVTINPSLCMGCKYCQWVCPYDAPKFNATTGVVEKCTFCSHRLKEDLEPACTTACPTAALRFEDYSKEDAKEQVDIPGFWKKRITPAIHIEPLRRGTRPPQMHHSYDLNELPHEANGSFSRAEVEGVAI